MTTSTGYDTTLQSAVDRLATRRGIHHAVLAVERGDGSQRWVGAAGKASPDGEPMRPDTPVHLASVVKPYTATAVMQLWERDVLDLDAPLAEYLGARRTANLHRDDGVDRTGAVTLRHLLSHTSGLPDYFLDAPKGQQSFADRLIEGDFHYTLDDVLARVRTLTPHFPPQDLTADRQKARYADTNFFLLGAVLEEVTGQPFHRVIEAQILEPLGLDDTWIAGHPRGHARTPATMWSGDGVLDVPEAMRSMGPDGGVVGTAADALAFLKALLAGAPFQRPDVLEHMAARWNRFGLPRDRSALMAPGWPIEYGLGLMRYRPPRLLNLGRRAPTFVGHSGASGSWLFYSPDHDLYLAGTVDQTTAAALPFRALPRLVQSLVR